MAVHVCVCHEVRDLPGSAAASPVQAAIDENGRADTDPQLDVDDIQVAAGCPDPLLGEQRQVCLVLDNDRALGYVGQFRTETDSIPPSDLWGEADRPVRGSTTPGVPMTIALTSLRCTPESRSTSSNDARIVSTAPRSAGS